MTITTTDQLLNVLGNNFTRFLIDKPSLANQVIGRVCSMWRTAGIPGQGAIPTAAAVPNKNTIGTLDFPNQTAPVQSYLGYLSMACSNANTGVELHDRIAHMGGLVLNSTAPQPVTGMDLETLAVPADRLGAADYSDAQWWLEVYTDGGATASNATITVTFDDLSSANLSVQAVGGTIRVGHMFPLRPLIPPAHSAKNIKGVTNVTLSGSTGTAGNFGFTVTRLRTTLAKNYVANKPETYTWVEMGMPNVPNDAAMVPLVFPGTTSSGTIRSGGKIVHG